MSCLTDSVSDFTSLTVVERNAEDERIFRCIEGMLECHFGWGWRPDPVMFPPGGFK
jgi:hypothetical protein